MESSWISVHQKLPDNDGWYLVYGRFTKDCPKRVMEAAFNKKLRKFHTMLKVKDVSHWQPLPAPPELSK
jgi:hypothetical protein